MFSRVSEFVQSLSVTVFVVVTKTQVTEKTRYNMKMTVFFFQYFSFAAAKSVKSSPFSLCGQTNKP